MRHQLRILGLHAKMLLEELISLVKVGRKTPDNYTYLGNLFSNHFETKRMLKRYRPLC